MYAELPEIEIAIDEEFEAEEVRPIYIDFDKVTPSQQIFFDKEAIIATGAAMSKFNTDSNPMRALTNLYNKLGRIATAIFPQCQVTHVRKRQPGWSFYVKEAQNYYSLARESWEQAGKPETGELLEDVNFGFQWRSDCIKEMLEQQDAYIAKILCDLYTSGEKRDRSNCWKPVKEAMKGNTASTSPVVNKLKNPQDIANFWAGFFKEKMKGVDSPKLEDSAEFAKMCEGGFPEVNITAQMVIEAIDNLNVK